MFLVSLQCERKFKFIILSRGIFERLRFFISDFNALVAMFWLHMHLLAAKKTGLLL